MKTQIVETTIKITHSILFVLCLLKMPYGYFQLVRFAGMVGFVLLAYFDFQKHRGVETESIKKIEKRIIYLFTVSNYKLEN